METPATRAADPESASGGARAEHVRNTAAASDHSGALGRLFAVSWGCRCGFCLGWWPRSSAVEVAWSAYTVKSTGSQIIMC